MTLSIQVDNHRLNYDKNPDICPVCHHAIEPAIKGVSRSGEPNVDGTFIDIAFQCVQGQCRRMFVGRYKRKFVANNGQTSGDFSLV